MIGRSFKVGWGLLCLGLWTLGQKKGERLCKILESLGPSFIKIGQFLAARPDLIGQDLAQSLGKLRDDVTSIKREKILNIIQKDFKQPWYALFDTMEKDSKTASVAQVHFATKDNRKLAVKVLRPEIKNAMLMDLQLCYRLVSLLEKVRPSLKQLNLKGIIKVIRSSLLMETDMRIEAAGMEEFRDNFLKDKDIEVPTVDWKRTKKHCLTMEHLSFIPLERKQLLHKGIDVETLSQRLVAILLKGALRDGFFHGDFHQGNVGLNPKTGRLIILDFGIMGRLEEKVRFFLIHVLEAFLKRQYQQVAHLHRKIGYTPKECNDADFAQACRGIGSTILDQPSHKISLGALLLQLFSVSQQFNMTIQPHLFLLQKTLIAVEGLAYQLNPKVNLWETSRNTISQLKNTTHHPKALLKRRSDFLTDMLYLLPETLKKLERTPPPQSFPWALVISSLGIGLLLGYFLL